MDRFGRPWIPFFKFGPNRRFLDLYFPLKNWTNSADFLKNSFLIGRFYFFPEKRRLEKRSEKRSSFFKIFPHSREKRISKSFLERSKKDFEKRIFFFFRQKRFWKKNLFLFSRKKNLKKYSFFKIFFRPQEKRIFRRPLILNISS